MTDSQQVAAENVAAVNAHDADRLRATYADDATLAAPGALVQGGDDATEYTMTWLRAFPDARQTIVQEYVAGDWVISEFAMSGTHTAPLETPEGDLPATNRRASARGVQIQRIAGGKILEERLYFDQLEVFAQLGLVPEPAAA